jgi:hypothetical protein
MTRASTSFALLMVVAACVAADEPPLKVTVQQLLANPKKFAGKRVDVSGYYRASLEDSSLLASARVADERWSTDNAIWLEPDIWDPRYHRRRPPNVSDVDALRGRTVRVIGTFSYRELKQRIVSSRGPRTIVEATRGNGWGGLWPRAIKNITYFRPLR